VQIQRCPRTLSSVSSRDWLITVRQPFCMTGLGKVFAHLHQQSCAMHLTMWKACLRSRATRAASMNKTGDNFDRVYHFLWRRAVRAPTQSAGLKKSVPDCSRQGSTCGLPTIRPELCLWLSSLPSWRQASPASAPSVPASARGSLSTLICRLKPRFALVAAPFCWTGVSRGSARFFSPALELLNAQNAL